MTAVYIRCTLLIILFLAFFCMASFVLEPVLKLTFKDISDRLVCGCLAYFLVFEIISVPMILTKQPFHRLVAIWLVMLFLWFLVLDPLLIIKGYCGRISFDGINIVSLVFLSAAAGVVIVTAAIAVCQRYIAWDPAFYIGTINTTLYTDTMYLYDGADGTPEKYINLRYALSGFYVQFAIFCSLFSIPARTMAWFVMRPLCVLVAAMSVYRLGTEGFIRTGRFRVRHGNSLITANRRIFAAVFVMLWAGVSFFWSGLHTTAYFMFVRGYEAKGWCANVVIPMVLCACVVLLRGRDADENEWWKRLGLACFASVPISMSSMALVPACVAILAFTLIVRHGQIKMTIIRAALCVLPNIIIVVLYLASKLELISIAAR